VFLINLKLKNFLFPGQKSHFPNFLDMYGCQYDFIRCYFMYEIFLKYIIFEYSLSRIVVNSNK